MNQKSIKNLKSGDLLVECERESHIKNLLKTTTFFDIKCQVKLHNTLNSSKGIVRCPALKGCTNEHIVEEMRDQGVLAVRRIQVRRDGQIRPTNTFVFTFNTPELPKIATVGYLRVPVEVYIPNPLRCYRCQMFGHHEDNCNRPAICVIVVSLNMILRTLVDVHGSQNVLTVLAIMLRIHVIAKPGTKKKKS